MVHTAIAGPRGDLHEALEKVAVERSRAAHYQRRRMQLPCRRSRGSGTGDAEVSEMIKCVARAINVTYQTHGQNGDLRTRALSDDMAAALARAAIEAMREPTKPMIDKAWHFLGSNLRYEEVYRHIIDAALGQRETRDGC